MLGHFNMPAEAKIGKVKVKCQTIHPSLTMNWQGHSIIIYGQNAMILDRDLNLI